ncbi:Putative zinc- or iron-chelating domain protein [uncultured archaeon]|nr:Putative zinc- or iron-chelating domain protein [uncultured archaeon]
MAANPAIVNSCKNCSARCCRGLAVVLTIPEALRLQQALSAPPEALFELSENVDSRKTPHYPILARQGRQVREFFIIIKREGADSHGAAGNIGSPVSTLGHPAAPCDCIFLNEDLACKIYAHRPYVCRLYPYELEGKNVKKGALCPVKFEREKGAEEDAKRLAQDLSEHGKMAREWSASHSEAPQIGRLLEYFRGRGNAI